MGVYGIYLFFYEVVVVVVREIEFNATAGWRSNLGYRGSSKKDWMNCKADLFCIFTILATFLSTQSLH